MSNSRDPRPELRRTPLVLATGNPHKVTELRALFGGAGIEVIGLSDLPPSLSLCEPVEHGSTFEQNASIKALSYAQQTGRICLADDSGIEIDALALRESSPPTPRPGVISSHYSTDGRDTDPPMTRDQRDAANNARVLRELEGIPPERRSARFVCVMALAVPPDRDTSRPAEVLHLSRGSVEGRIGIPPRVPAGTYGFGYDPLVLVGPDFTRTVAELGAEEKNRRSHRAAAAAGMRAWLTSR